MFQHSSPRRRVAALAAVAVVPVSLLVPAASSTAAAATRTGDSPPATPDSELGTVSMVDDRYLITLAGRQAADGGFATDAAMSTVKALISAAGGQLVTDLSRQIGVVVAESGSAGFASSLSVSPLIDSVGNDFAVKMYASDAPDPSADPLEALQWDMQQIRTEQAHQTQAGISAVDVGVLDSGIDGRHPDFTENGVTNVDCARGRDSLAVLPPGVAVGTPDPCTDNQFHGTHVAGTIGARANGVGIVGVAPNVTLVPVKVCDATGFCYASPVVDGITYAGDQQFDVINMSFFVDDNAFQESHEFKCASDPVQRTFRQAVERAISYARNRGVTQVAALGNSDQDLAHPVDENGQPISNDCDVVPAETQGVVGTMALGARSEKAGYSNYGTGMTDVAAPGGNGTTGDCRTTILSTLPGGAYGCIQGTSMASPHAAGVAALIVSQFGRLAADGDVKLSPQTVENYLQGTAVDIGLPGYDECFGNGRIDAARAVAHDTSAASDPAAPACPEYQE
jgi:subtilisin family serine protease